MKESNFGYRPIELVHDFEFIPCCFPQDTALPKPKERLDRLKALGYGGVAVCPSYRDYLSKESFSELTDAIIYAKSIGLSVWIYDEKYYPSGGADGKVTREDPRLEAKALACLVGEPDELGMICINSPHGHSGLIYAFAASLKENGEPDFSTLRDVSHKRTFGGGLLLDCKNAPSTRAYAFFGKSAFEFCATSHNTRGIRRYIDTLCPDATRAFLNKTYGGYGRLGELSKYIDAVFTDEPQIPALCRTDYVEGYKEFVKKIENSVFAVRDNPDSGVMLYPFIPWTEGLEEEFLRMHGYPLPEVLALIFFDRGEDGGRHRANLWETVSELFYKSYGSVYADFCRERSVAYSGHLLYEEEFECHPYMHGDALRQLGCMDIPGCDMLFASPEGILDHASAVKLAASAAHLYGRREVMIEASNIVKDVFPITESALKLATAMESALGATRFLSYYTEWALPECQTRACCDFTERLQSTLAGARPIYRVYLYIPTGDIYSESYPSVSPSQKPPLSPRLDSIRSFLRSSARVFTECSIDFCYINDERLSALSADVFSGAALVVPHGAGLPKYSEKFAEVIRDGSPTDVAKELTLKGYATAIAEGGRLICTRRRHADRDIYLFVNLGEDFVGEARLLSCKSEGYATVYDPHTEECVTVRLKDSKIPLEIPAFGCKTVTVTE